MFEKEMKVFLLNQTTERKAPELKLQLVWDMSHDKHVGEVVSAIIYLVLVVK